MKKPVTGGPSSVPIFRPTFRMPMAVPEYSGFLAVDAHNVQYTVRDGALQKRIDKNEGQQQSGILHAEAQQKDERVQDKADDADKPAPTDPDVVQQPADEDNHRDLDGVHDGNPPVGLAHIAAEERLSPVQRDIRGEAEAAEREEGAGNGDDPRSRRLEAFAEPELFLVFSFGIVRHVRRGRVNFPRVQDEHDDARTRRRTTKRPAIQTPQSNRRL